MYKSSVLKSKPLLRRIDTLAILAHDGIRSIIVRSAWFDRKKNPVGYVQKLHRTSGPVREAEQCSQRRQRGAHNRIVNEQSL